MMLRVYTCGGLNFSVGIYNGVGVFPYSLKNLEYFVFEGCSPMYFDKVFSVKVGDQIEFIGESYRIIQ